MQPYELERRFRAHDVNQGQVARIQRVRDLTLQYARDVCALTPEGRDESVFVANLEQASFAAEAAIAREGV